MSRDDALHAIWVLLLMTSACWPHATPTPARFVLPKGHLDIQRP
ncbi:hypothetical protein [Donghicola tyrosinivorans]